MTTTTTDQKQMIKDYLTTLGLGYHATFIPTPQPAEKVPNPQLHWLITLTRKGQSIQVPYFEGVAHVQGYQAYHKTPYDKRQAEQRYRLSCETGKLFPEGTQPAPDVCDVLYCLVMEADVLNTSSYEEWASEYGYDEDSRKGEALYQQCLKQSLALKGLIGWSALERLRELFQDY